jgi:hypothetical protein
MDGTTARIPIVFWREGAQEGGRSADPHDDDMIPSAHAAFEARLNDTRAFRNGVNLHFDVVERADGGCSIAATWRHTLLDAKGAELLLAELDRGAGSAAMQSSVEPSPRPPSDDRRDRVAREGRWRRLLMLADHLNELGASGFRSLAGREPRAGVARYRVLTLDRAQTAAVRQHARAFGGELFLMPFFLGCAVRAHDRAFRDRGIAPPAYVVSLPVQTRRNVPPLPILQNHVSILFFLVKHQDSLQLGDTVRSVFKQYAAMVRDRLDEAFTHALELARRLPSRFYLSAARYRFGGEISSFFHSYTGGFAPDLETFLGCRIRNAFHAPVVSTPPGTGIFVGESQGRLNLTACWRDDVVTKDEVDTMLDRLTADLLGSGADDGRRPVPPLVSGARQA